MVLHLADWTYSMSTCNAGLLWHLRLAALEASASFVQHASDVSQSTPDHNFKLSYAETLLPGACLLGTLACHCTASCKDSRDTLFHRRIMKISIASAHRTG